MTRAWRNAEMALSRGREGALRPAQHVHQAALAETQAEQIRERALQPLVGQGLEGLQIGCHGMDARSKRRSLRRLRRRRDHPRSAGRAPNRQTPMARDRRLELGKLDHLVLADGLGGKSAGQAGAAARALVGTMIDDAIGILAQRAAVAFVTRLGPARPGFLSTLLAVSRRRLGRGVRRLRRALHPQHQLDQLLLRETLQLGAIHDLMDSGISATDKGRG
jgi:hypothetical protein